MKMAGKWILVHFLSVLSGRWPDLSRALRGSYNPIRVSTRAQELDHKVEYRAVGSNEPDKGNCKC